MKKRLMAFILILAMVTGLFSPAACKNVLAASTVTSNDGNFYHASEIYLTKDFKAKYYYMDDYFKKSSTTYQNSLATMSMCLAMSAFRSNRAEKYANKSQNLKALLKACGFTNFKASSGFKSRPTENSTGTGIASKKITVNGKKYTLIAVAISGGCIEAEWGGILRIGKDGNGKNAQNGANNAFSFLKEYVKDQKISGNVKLWITGFGVGGGKANLLAGKIDDKLNLGSGVKLKKSNVYAYTFQSPQLASTSHGLHNETYNNIFNICNPYDAMTLLAPDEYKLGRYGIDKFTPTKSTDSNYAGKRDAMLKKMNAMDGSFEYCIDEFHMKEINIFGSGFVADSSSNADMGQFLNDFVDNIIVSCARTRSEYVDDFEDDIADLLGVMQGNADENWQECLELFIEKVQNNILSLGIQMIFGNESQLANMFEDYAWDCIAKAGVKDITDQDVKTFSKVLARLAVEFAIDYPNQTVTFFYNMLPLFAAHEPVMNLAWLQSVDDNYNGKKFTNEITANNISKTVSSSDRTVALNAKAKGNAKLSYKSNNSNITVKSNGKMTIEKNFIGKATITITSAATSKYKKTTKKITVTVKPEKATIKSVALKYSKKKKKNMISLEMKKDAGNVVYEIQYATNSKFKNATTLDKQVKYVKGGYYVVEDPKKGKTYYFRIKGCKTVNGTTYKGKWSAVKSIKVN